MTNIESIAPAWRFLTTNLTGTGAVFTCCCDMTIPPFAGDRNYGFVLTGDVATTLLCRLYQPENTAPQIELMRRIPDRGRHLRFAIRRHRTQNELSYLRCRERLPSRLE